MSNIKDNVKFGLIKTTSIVLGTVYVACKLGAESAKNLEAEIIHGIDESCDKRLIRRSRMESYFEVMNKARDINERINERAEAITRSMMKRKTTQELLLIDQERMSHVS